MGYGDLLPGGKNKITDVLGTVAVVGAVYNALFPKTPKVDPASTDDFSLAKFTAALNADARRLAKGYHYNAMFYLAGDIKTSLAFQCNKVNLPGWRAKTQTGKIYGVSYEIVVEMEQDPIWVTFNSDIRHKIEEFFFSTRKQSIFDINTSTGVGSYSPKYKNQYQFNMELQVTDENFTPLINYVFDNATIRTVQQVQYGAGDTELSSITCEIVYENVIANRAGAMEGRDYDRGIAKPNKTAKNKNQLKIGPFQTDISGVNQVLDGFGAVPGWFESPEKN